MSNSSSVKEAVKFYLASQGLHVIDQLKFHEMQTEISLQFYPDHIQPVQLLCRQGRFDLAREFKESAESILIRLDSNHSGEVVELTGDFPVADSLGDLEDNLVKVYVDHYSQHLDHIERVLQAANEACEGPLDTVIWEFMTPGAMTVKLEAKYDDIDCYPDSYFDSGDPESDWLSMEYALESPFVVFTLSCEVTDCDGNLIGSSALGSCSASSGSEDEFRKEVIKEYRGQLVHEALHAARQAMPKNRNEDGRMSRRPSTCHTTQA